VSSSSPYALAVVAARCADELTSAELTTIAAALRGDLVPLEILTLVLGAIDALEARLERP
jgi:hypothetical protein